MCTEINPFLHTKANWGRNLQTCNACRLPYLVRVVLEAKTDNLFSSTSLLHPMARTHPVLIWRQVELSSGAKTCTHASSHHFSLWKHSHRVSDWLANSSRHKTDFMNHFIPSVDCLAHVFDTLRQDLKEDIVSFPQPWTTVPGLPHSNFSLNWNNYFFWYQCWKESWDSSVCT